MGNSKKIAALFVRRDSVYKQLSNLQGLPEIDCYDIDRDTKTFPGGMPVICHPPCRTWGRYAHRAKAPAGEHKLAEWAVEQVSKWGGVLEHPITSRLTFPLPRPIYQHYVSGKHRHLYKLNQGWFGHRALKPTIIYVVSTYPLIEIADIIINAAEKSKERQYRPLEKLSKKEREATPREFAEFLIWIAERC